MRSNYAPGASGAGVRIVSPLAEGADRLVAEEGLRLGAALFAPLPFAQQDYEADFEPESVTAFRALLSQGQKLELDGARGDPSVQTSSYAEIGRFVVRNCDLLIAIWDGQPERGRGGTAEIVRFAVQVGLPVWWIQESAVEPGKLVTRLSHLNVPATAPDGERAEAELKRYLFRSIVPPEAAAPERHGVFGDAGRVLRAQWKPDAAPLQEFFDECAPPRRALWSAYDRMMGLVAPAGDRRPPGLSAPANSVEEFWRNIFVPADSLSGAYGARYRSSYVLTAALAVVALVAAAVAATKLPAYSLGFSAVEIIVLGAIAILVVANHMHRWQERWISYRLLAELCRKQYSLATIGYALPAAEVVRMSLELTESPRRPELPRDVWIAWYFMAMVRAAPAPVGDLASIKHHALDVARSLIKTQEAYHEARWRRTDAAGRRIGALGEAFFIITIFGAIANFFALWMHIGGVWIDVVELVGALLSATTAALVGIKAYSEFALLARQSRHMLRVLREASSDIERIPLDHPLGSCLLGRALFALATAMLADSTGWAQLFRLKTIETA